MVNHKELIIKKKKVDFLSIKARESNELLMQLCKEISFAENLSSEKNNQSEADHLIYILSTRIINHLTYTHQLILAYKEYSKMLEKLNLQVIMRAK